jgi:hypothetical protein
VHYGKNTGEWLSQYFEILWRLARNENRQLIDKIIFLNNSPRTEEINMETQVKDHRTFTSNASIPAI